MCLSLVCQRVAGRWGLLPADNPQLGGPCRRDHAEAASVCAALVTAGTASASKAPVLLGQGQSYTGHRHGSDYWLMAAGADLRLALW